MPDEWQPCLVIKHTVQSRRSSWLGKCCVKLRLSQARSWELFLASQPGPEGLALA